MTNRTRFAPSPNGLLHLGHAYAAVIAHDLARAGEGEFLVRIEDIDGTRSREDLAAEMLADLEWLGLPRDRPVLYQSSRIDAYARAGEELIRRGLLYPCTCTRAEIAAAAREIGPDGPIYPGTCRGREPDQGISTAWRLDVARASALAGTLWWHDALAGEQLARPDLLGDVVLLRKDAPASYHLAATLDDAFQGISLVTRGMDLFASTHIHRLLQALLGLPVPRWHHHPLLVEADGRKLAKRRGSPALKDLRDGGADGLALARALRDGRFPAGISLGQGLDTAP